jgi:hypothetical protein
MRCGGIAESVEFHDQTMAGAGTVSASERSVL